MFVIFIYHFTLINTSRSNPAIHCDDLVFSSKWGNAVWTIMKCTCILFVVEGIIFHNMKASDLPLAACNAVQQTTGQNQFQKVNIPFSHWFNYIYLPQEYIHAATGLGIVLFLVHKHCVYIAISKHKKTQTTCLLGPTLVQHWSNIGPTLVQHMPHWISVVMEVPWRQQLFYLKWLNVRCPVSIAMWEIYVRWLWIIYCP